MVPERQSPAKLPIGVGAARQPDTNSSSAAKTHITRGSQIRCCHPPSWVGWLPDERCWRVARARAAIWHHAAHPVPPRLRIRLSEWILRAVDPPPPLIADLELQLYSCPGTGTEYSSCIRSRRKNGLYAHRPEAEDLLLPAAEARSATQCDPVPRARDSSLSTAGQAEGYVLGLVMS